MSIHDRVRGRQPPSLEEIRAALGECYPLWERRWLSIPVLDEADAEDVEKLLQVLVLPAGQAG